MDVKYNRSCDDVNSQNYLSCHNQGCNVRSVSVVLPERIRQCMAAAGVNQSELARRVGVTQQTIGKLVTGKANSSIYLHVIARVLGTTPEYLTGDSEDSSPSGIADNRGSYRAGPPAAPFSSGESAADLGVVPVREIDLAFGMGATYLDVPVTGEVHHFPLAWIRAFTRSPPEQLVFARGAGDSMFPTIQDSDLLLIDLAQCSPKMGDRIWAIAFGEVGMIKRLRPMPDGSVKILSDNPQIPPETAVDGEMHVIGRVVAVMRKM